MGRIDDLQTDGELTPPSAIREPRGSAEEDAQFLAEEERRRQHPLLREPRMRDTRAEELELRRKMIENGEIDQWCTPDNNALFNGDLDDED